MTDPDRIPANFDPLAPDPAPEPLSDSALLAIRRRAAHSLSHHLRVVNEDVVLEHARDVQALLGEVGRLREPIPETYACQRCGRKDGLDAVMADADWERVSAAAGGVNLLCLWCVDELAASLGIRGSVALHFCGRAIAGASQSDADAEHVSRLVDQRDAASAEAVALREALRLLLTCVDMGSEDGFAIAVKMVRGLVSGSSPTPAARGRSGAGGEEQETP